MADNRSKWPVFRLDRLFENVADPCLRAHYISSVYAARIMVPNGSGLIVNMSSSGGIMHMASAAYGIGKAAKDRMAQDLNKELDGTGRDPLTVRARQNHSLDVKTDRQSRLRDST